MRKIVLSILCIISMQQAFAYLNQTHYRWRNDNGSQTSATWRAAENSSMPIFGTMDNYRLRFGFDGDCCGRPYSQTGTLMYAVQGSGVWNDVTTSSNAAFMLAGSSPYVTNNEATTRQLSNPAGGSFVPGRVITNSNNVSITLNSGERTEYEWVIKPGTTIQTNTVYEFMFSSMDVIHNVFATLSTSGTLPLQLVSISVQQVGKVVQLQWTTANEVNVKHFEIERSTDGIQFTSINQVTAKGSNGQNNYSYEDASPNSRNYYRLKTVDSDGSINYSKILPVHFNANGKALSVFPNPATNKLQVQLTAPAGKVQVLLLDVAGKILKSFDVQSNGSTLTADADISTLPKGMYFIKYNNEIVKFIKE